MILFITYKYSRLFTVSLIAETKKKRNANELRPILPSRKVNPFKKASQHDTPSVVAATSSNEDQPTHSTANKKVNKTYSLACVSCL